MTVLFSCTPLHYSGNFIIEIHEGKVFAIKGVKSIKI
jgi:hypothetical protein